jgi:hypothetical protein
MGHDGRGSCRGRGRGRGLGARLAHGIATVFSMCRDISANVHELARRQRKTNDNLRRQSVSLGHPFAPRSPDVPLHAPHPDVNEWHQQAYGVPFMSTDDDEVEEDFLADDVDQFAAPISQGDPDPSSSYPPPQDPSGNTPPPTNPGEENFVVNLAARFFDPSPPW